MPVVSAMADVHRDHFNLDSKAQWPEIQPLQGQIISADPPLLTDRQL